MIEPSPNLLELMDCAAELKESYYKERINQKAYQRLLDIMANMSIDDLDYAIER